MKRVFPNNYLLMVFIFAIMTGIFGYSGYITSNYFAIVIMILMLFFFINRRVYLNEDNIVIYQGFKKIVIYYNDIEKMYIKPYKIKFSRGNTIPAIYIKCIGNQSNIFYYKNYDGNKVCEIINTAKERNYRIILCSEIESILNKNA